MAKVTNREKAAAILQTYSGDNQFIRWYQYLSQGGKFDYNDFAVDYILGNYDYVPRDVNRMVDITAEAGKKIKDRFSLDFCPTKLYVSRVVGEIGNSYHCFVQFRRSVPPQLTLINRNHILGNIDGIDWKEFKVDFRKLDKKGKESGRTLKAHQREGVRFLVANKKCILADKMGLGKSLEAVAAAIVSKSKKILILCPASLKTNWKREISFYDDPDKVAIVSGSDWKVGKRWTIVNYDILKNFHKVPYEPVFETVEYMNDQGVKCKEVRPVMVKNRNTGEMEQMMRKTCRKDAVRECLEASDMAKAGFDCVIIDEAHKLSNSDSNRYRIIHDYLHKCKPEYCFLLTGTPLVNKPINLYSVLQLIDATVSRDYVFYTKRYCGAHKIHLKNGRTVTLTNGASHLDELSERLKCLYLRRDISDVEDMVTKSIVTKYYDLDERQEAEYRKLWDDYVRAQLEKGDNDNEEYRQLVEGMLVRQYLAKEMIPYTIGIVDEWLSSGEKVIVVCTFQEEIKAFKKHYGKKAAVFDGVMTLKRKDKAVSDFMTDPNVSVFIGQIEAAGTGLTLTEARYMVFNSYSWIAASNKQMEDRIYRITQDRDVTCVYQVFNDEISRHMYETVQGKQYMSDTLIRKENDK